MLSNLEIACPLCGKPIAGSRQLIDVCPSCMQPWREAYFQQQQQDTGDTKQAIADFVVNAFIKSSPNESFPITFFFLESEL